MDLKGPHYNTKHQVRTIEALFEKLPNASTRGLERTCRRAPRTAKQLDDEQVRKLIAAYEAGATVYDLATQFKINRKTVSEILHREGVRIRGRLSNEQVDEAVRLYDAGRSLARIGSTLGTTANTVRARLLERGVTTRDTQGRER